MSKDNSTIKAILARRSIRAYENKAVAKEDIDLLLECACAAPSANNFRPWHFVVVTERSTLDAIAEIHTYGKMLRQAPLAIVVCAEKERGGQTNSWWEQDCGAAMQNILVGASALGLGSVWLGVNHASGDRELPNKIRRILGIPASVEVMGIAAVGYAAEIKAPHSGTDKGTIHTGTWTSVR